MSSDTTTPRGWKTARIGELATFRNGSAFNENHWRACGLPIIRIQNLNGSAEFNHFDGDPANHVVINPGDLLFSWSGNRGTSFGPFVWNGPRGVLNQHIFKVTPAEGIDRQFLLQVLREVTKAIEKQAHGGTGIVHVRKSEVENFKVLLPPAEYRSVISNVLWAIDETIEATRAVTDQTRQLKIALLQELLTRGLPGRHRHFVSRKTAGRLPSQWSYLPLAEVATFQNGKAFPSTHYGKGSAPLMRPGNLHPSGRVTWDEDHTTTLPDRYWTEAADWIVGGDELVMNLTAQSLEDQFLGRVCWTHPKDGKSLLNQRIARFRPLACSLRFLYWTFKGPLFRRYVDRLPQGSKVQHLYNSDLEGFCVPLPEPDEQAAIVALLDSCESREESDTVLLNVLCSTKAALSQGLLTGRIPVPIPAAKSAANQGRDARKSRKD
jgi:type I restriction enzyme S subunit